MKVISRRRLDRLRFRHDHGTALDVEIITSPNGEALAVVALSREGLRNGEGRVRDYLSCTMTRSRLARLRAAIDAADALLAEAEAGTPPPAVDSAPEAPSAFLPPRRRLHPSDAGLVRVPGVPRGRTEP